MFVTSARPLPNFVEKCSFFCFLIYVACTILLIISGLLPKYLCVFGFFVRGSLFVAAAAAVRCSLRPLEERLLLRFRATPLSATPLFATPLNAFGYILGFWFLREALLREAFLREAFLREALLRVILSRMIPSGMIHRLGFLFQASA
jgi:hypothetical protein